MRNTDILLPWIIEDYDEVGTYRKEVFFDPDEYRPLVDILYITREREIPEGKYHVKKKKQNYPISFIIR